MKQNRNEQGFTLVELSIVLIIIGLIVGGVLAGQSLIRSARLQNDITKFNQIDASVNSFNVRYNGLPGDLSNATSFFTGTAQPTLVTNGNGNGIVASGTSGFVAAGAATEVSAAFDHLAAAGMVALGQYSETAQASNAINVGILPSRTAGGIVLYGANSRNFVRFSVSSNAAADALLLTNLFTAEQVSFIDNKLDDNNAINGIVTSANATTLDTAGIVATDGTECNSAAGVYAVGITTANCAFRVRLSS